ncbi:MAG: hypothetical protein LC723_12260 [Actinobacteria bacterium]|nr:hypothetical protein [Actinomycetota bacterium]
MAKTPAPKIALATHADMALYTVTYPGSVDMDAKVPYSYLLHLTRQGYDVHVEASESEPAYLLPAKPQKG